MSVSLIASLLSFLKTWSATLECSVRRNIGKVQEITGKQRIFFFIFALTCFLVPLVLRGIIVFYIRLNWMSYIHKTDSVESWLCLFALALLAVNPLISISLHLSILGCSVYNFLNGLLSWITPCNFVGKSLHVAKLYLYLYIGINEVLNFLSLTAIGASYYLHMRSSDYNVLLEVIFLCITPLGITTIIKWTQIFFVRYSLTHLYKYANYCHPSYVQITDRLKSFPPNFEVQVSKSQLAENGHFYSDPRLTNQITSCCNCDKNISWLSCDLSELQYHNDVCSFNPEDSEEITARMDEGDEKSLLDWILTGFGGIFSFVVMLHLSLLTYSLTWSNDNWQGE